MEITEKQIQQIARSISVLDIKAYIEQHRQDFEELLEDEESRRKEH